MAEGNIDISKLKYDSGAVWSGTKTIPLVTSNIYLLFGGRNTQYSIAIIVNDGGTWYIHGHNDIATITDDNLIISLYSRWALLWIPIY